MTNEARVAICKALEEKITQSQIAVRVRRSMRPDWNAKTTEPLYRSILEKIRKVKDAKLKGQLDHVLKPMGSMSTSEKAKHKKTMSSKSIKPNVRGRAIPTHEQDVEKELITRLDKMWVDQKRVSRSIVFRTVLEIDPNFKAEGPGVKGSQQHLMRLKNWFYYGFNRRHKLTNRRISGAGQKLPKDWQSRHKVLVQRLAAYQQPAQHPSTGEPLPAIEDEHMYNTDHVPTYYEPHGNYTWGKSGSGRRSVKTGGKEKDRFTTQLTISKRGDKLRPYVILKGTFASFPPHFMCQCLTVRSVS